MPLAPEQLRELGDVGSDPARLLAREHQHPALSDIWTQWSYSSSQIWYSAQ
jgi:hypothetical protein